MANLAFSAVTENEYWREGLNNRFVTKDLTLVLTGQGGTTNKILASTLGFSAIRKVHSAVVSDGTHLNAAPSYDRSYITLAAKGSGTPADQTLTARLIVVGKD